MDVLLLLQGADAAGFGEVVKSVAAIGLEPTLLIVALYAYKIGVGIKLRLNAVTHERQAKKLDKEVRRAINL